MLLSPIEEIIEDIMAGKMVIVCNDKDRESEGDLTMAAELVTLEDINFMATHGCGLICLPMRAEMLDGLQILDMVRHPQLPVWALPSRSLSRPEKAS
jgi:3,4-dihydroxy 2-butanone 4-phosphate synthase / GTP cyclohydrolase II